MLNAFVKQGLWPEFGHGSGPSGRIWILHYKKSIGSGFCLNTRIRKTGTRCNKLRNIVFSSVATLLIKCYIFRMFSSLCYKFGNFFDIIFKSTQGSQLTEGFVNTLCPRSLDSFYEVSWYIQWGRLLGGSFIERTSHIISFRYKTSP